MELGRFTNRVVDTQRPRHPHQSIYDRLHWHAADKFRQWAHASDSCGLGASGGYHTAMDRPNSWQWAQSVGALEHDLDITTGAAFKWWLWVATLEQSHGDVVRSGILHATATTDAHSWAQFRFTCCDGTSFRVLLKKSQSGSLSCRVYRGDPA